MRTEPKSEAQIRADGLLDPGIYAFEVTDAYDDTSKAGNDMMVLKIRIFDAQGRARILTDYLLPSVAYKLRNFCLTAGVIRAYEAGNLDPEAVKGRYGRVKLKIRKSEEYGDQNQVADYGDPNAPITAAAPTRQTASAPTRARQPVAAGVDDLDDEIPF